MDADASPLFPPEHTSNDEASSAVLQRLRSGPPPIAARWTLRCIRESLPWLHLSSDSGTYRLLRRLGIAYKRAREYLHSPDPLYREKAAYVETCLDEARAEPERLVLVYQDEAAYYRQPTLGRDYEARGSEHQPLAHRSHKSDTKRRIAACLDAVHGRVLYRSRSKAGVDVLVGLYEDLALAYPEAQRIYVVQDNWPIHFHPGVVQHLEPQAWPFSFHTHPDWPEPHQVERLSEVLPIQLVPLPTYAPWLNPIEKLWRWLRQEVLHLHRLSDAWEELKQRVEVFLDQFTSDSPELLRYVGLLPNQ